MTEKSSKEKTISIQYADLHKFSQNEEYERALKAANKILGLAPHEYLSFHSKIVCLIQLAKFDEAIIQINKNPEYLQNLIFEKSYSLYRLNKHHEAIQTIRDSENKIDDRTKELLAQILYRLEEYKNAYEVYHEIIKNTYDDYDEERRVNIYATMVQMNDEEIDEDDLDDRLFQEPPYELCFNEACRFIAAENFNEAEKKLKQAERLCRAKLEEDEEVTEEEIDLELALIRIQIAFVYQKLGRIKEAQTLYTTNLRLKLEDLSLQAIACNNIVCINKDQNLFDSKKKMKIALNQTLIHKLPSMQRKNIALNSAILSYYINHLDACENICKVIENTWPELIIKVQLIRALSLVKVDRINDAIQLLKAMDETDDENWNLFIKLSIVQFYLINGDKLEACKLLENLGKDTYRPGIIGALTTLYLALGDENNALKIFEKSVEFYKKSKTKSADLSGFWRQAADFHMRNGHPQVAANSLEELLLTSNKRDKKIAAQLVLACTQFDKPRALKLSQDLPTIKELSKDIDIESIHTLAPSGIAINKSPGTTGGKGSSQGTPRSLDTDPQKIKRKRTKKRKGPLPKFYDPKVQPDPERWLPKYERTGFRKKRDRRNAKEVIKGSQGTSFGQTEQFDFSKKTTEEVHESPSVSVENTPRGQNKSQHSANKKTNQKKKNKRR